MTVPVRCRAVVLCPVTVRWPSARPFQGELSKLTEEKRKSVCQEQSRCRKGRASEELGLTLHAIGRQGEASEQEGDVV